MNSHRDPARDRVRYEDARGSLAERIHEATPQDERHHARRVDPLHGTAGRLRRKDDGSPAPHH